MRATINEMINARLDKLARTRVQIFSKSLPAFRACGYAGLCLAMTLSMTLVTRLGLSQGVMVALIIAAVLTFLALVMLTKIITGEESITYYHHEIAVVTIAALLLSMLRQPILPYLDVTILGVGIFLACGRVGCLMVGCCYGRPHHLGMCYNEDHAAAGFSSYYVGVRLFPVQALESLWVFCIVIIGSITVMKGSPAGESFALYVVAYDIGRFCFEFLRGDARRRYYLGFSEAQWISLLLMCAVVLAELQGALTFRSWHAAATVCMMVTMIAVAVRRHFQKEGGYKLYGAQHLKEVAQAVQTLSDLATETTVFPGSNLVIAEAHIANTFLGVQISASRIGSGTSFVNHYALSYRDKIMPKETAARLAALIVRLKNSRDSNELVDEHSGIYHLLIHSRALGPVRSQSRGEYKSRGALSLK